MLKIFVSCKAADWSRCVLGAGEISFTGRVRQTPHAVEYALSVVTGVLCFLLLLSQRSLAADVCSVDAGGPDCAGFSDPGSIVTDYQPNSTIGNPIDVMSGNKYQGELDVLAFDSRLMFKRHYNSLNVRHNRGLGQGWRHSYDVELSYQGQELLITQSDGRAIRFREFQGRDGFVSYKTAAKVDGLVERGGGKTSWVLPDGRMLSFKGPLLTRIDFDSGQYLKLVYRNHRLWRIFDESGRFIELHYHSGDHGLVGFNAVPLREIAGHLSSLTLPEGAKIRFLYDDNYNLAQVTYPDGSESRYFYQNPVFDHLLTERRVDGLTVGKWSYNDFGEAISYNNMAGTILDLDFNIEGNLGETTVSDNHGNQAFFKWHRDNRSGQKLLLSSVGQQCVGCPVVGGSYSYDSAYNAVLENVDKGNRPVARKATNGIDQLGSNRGFQTLDTDGLGNPTLVVSRLSDEREETTFSVSYDTRGSIVEIVNLKSGGVVKYRDLLKEGEVGFSYAVNPNGPDKPAADDSDIALLILDATELRFRIHLQGPRLGPGNEPSTLPDNLNICTNTFDCADLNDAVRFADLSLCAYGPSACQNTWEYDLMSPADLGIDASLLEGFGFHAEVFRHQTTGDLVIAFRGTDSVVDVITDLQLQWGDSSTQIAMALDLSEALVAANPGINITTTGHSLGGTLATAAAIYLNTSGMVFNSATLHPLTADEHGIDYFAANSLVENYVVEGDAVTQFQAHEGPSEFSVVYPSASSGNVENWWPLPSPAALFELEPPDPSQGGWHQHRITTVIDSIYHNANTIGCSIN